MTKVTNQLNETNSKAVSFIKKMIAIIAGLVVVFLQLPALLQKLGFTVPMIEFIDYVLKFIAIVYLSYAYYNIIKEVDKIQNIIPVLEDFEKEIDGLKQQIQDTSSMSKNNSSTLSSTQRRLENVEMNNDGNKITISSIQRRLENVEMRNNNVEVEENIQLVLSELKLTKLLLQIYHERIFKERPHSVNTRYDQQKANQEDFKQLRKEGYKVFETHSQAEIDKEIDQFLSIYQK